jgi:hypothetical protein
MVEAKGETMVEVDIRALETPAGKMLAAEGRKGLTSRRGLKMAGVMVDLLSTDAGDG